MDDNTELYDRIMQIINSHVGEKSAINQNRLLVQIHQAEYKFRFEVPNTRTLLRLIHDMRRAGFMIASCSRGYFRPADGEEAKTYIKRVLESRASDLHETIAAQKRAIAVEYYGQMKMEE